MTKQYTIEDLKKIHYQSTHRGGYRQRQSPRASCIYHTARENEKSAGRNDFNINFNLLEEIGIKDKKAQVSLMCANFPETKMQVIFNPKGIEGPVKTVKQRVNSGGIMFGMGSMIPQFARENGYELTDKKNYFACDLKWEKTYENGKMIGIEFSLSGLPIHEHRP